MGKVISFGDSFVAGLGTDRIEEDKFLKGRPDWDTLSHDRKIIQRELCSQFRRSNSFTAFFAKELGFGWINNGSIGCDNKTILNSIFQYQFDSGFEEDDIVLIGFTSSLRDRPSWLPKIITQNTYNGVSFSFGELFRYMNNKQMLVWKDKLMEKSYDKFTRDYFKRFVMEFWDERYYDINNVWMISIIQHFLEFHKVKYIMFDAFDIMISNENKYLNNKCYWKVGQSTIHDFLKDFNDEDLLELDGYSMNDAKKHPSKRGHKVFAKELLRFYNEIF